MLITCSQDKAVCALAEESTELISPSVEAGVERAVGETALRFFDLSKRDIAFVHEDFAKRARGMAPVTGSVKEVRKLKSLSVQKSTSEGDFSLRKHGRSLARTVFGFYEATSVHVRRLLRRPRRLERIRSRFRRRRILARIPWERAPVPVERRRALRQDGERRPTSSSSTISAS